MTNTLRPMTELDVETCGRICFEAFSGIAGKHNFPPDFQSVEQAIQVMSMLNSSPQIYSVVAEVDGQIAGSNHLSEMDDVRSVGPITIDPKVQAKGIGRMLMQDVINRGKGSRSIRLVQDAFNTASMSLYTSLGFDIKEPLVLIAGVISADVESDVEVRQLKTEDVEECGELCRATIGFDRTNELKSTPPFLPSYVAIRDGKIRAYASAPHFWALNHAVAEKIEDMQAVLAGACALGDHAPISLLLPNRQSELFRWMLRSGMKVVKPLNLMSMGEYEDPKQVYLPSVGY
jgi:predicted N-acetyltransferase YhbS